MKPLFRTLRLLSLLLTLCTLCGIILFPEHQKGLTIGMILFSAGMVLSDFGVRED